MVKTKSTKACTAEGGPGESPNSPGKEHHEESSVPADMVLAALETLRREVAQNKKDICATIDSRIETFTENLKKEFSTMKGDTQTALAAIKATMLAHTEAIKEVEGPGGRNNIHMIGVPEGKEGKRPREFISQLLTDLLSLEQKPLIDRCHRSLRQRPSDGQPPRPFILRLHYYHAVEDILRKAAGSGNLIYQGKRIQLFPDYPPTVVNRRREFTPAREILRNKPGVRYGLLYPARLIVTHGDQQQHSFTDPKAALDYARRHFGAPEARPIPDG
ncbi:LINE-1 retrotransposable element ORF1 protein [Dissostichus eleginoides]|uniref:LINE-1 retrotransposable element ORF1 protein n=1 Tax=Dissostichus eleginoides TaxID=100907 RepID=A0AAD9CED6_DISEL|nr:LINE-1 retrotransposable element ORF1 protein [Dissostichus eleginoides]